MVDFLGCKHTLPSHIQFFIHQYSQALLHRKSSEDDRSWLLRLLKYIVSIRRNNCPILSTDFCNWLLFYSVYSTCYMNNTTREEIHTFIFRYLKLLCPPHTGEDWAHFTRNQVVMSSQGVTLGLEEIREAIRKDSSIFNFSAAVRSFYAV